MAYAKVNLELVAQIPRIKEMLIEGHSTFRIFEKLKNEGRITASRSSFYRFVRKYIDFKQIDEEIKKQETKKKSVFKSNNNFF